MRGRARLLASALALLSLAVGCSNPSGLPDLTISLVDANGANPLGARGIDRVRVL
jgi:hypothetical protein